MRAAREGRFKLVRGLKNLMRLSLQKLLRNHDKTITITTWGSETLPRDHF